MSSGQENESPIQLVGPFEKEELQRAVERDPSFEPFNMSRLKRSAEYIFNSPFINSSKHSKLIEENYNGLNVERHGAANLARDLQLLTEYMSATSSMVKSMTEDRTDRILFMGEGPGRTSIAAIELAKKLGYKEVVFNDLIERHVASIRKKVRSVYGNPDKDKTYNGLKITYHSGDILNYSDDFGQFDAIFAMWFVTAEIADFSSIEALQKKRKQLYKKIHLLLSKQGLFVEDVPYSEGVGTFYYLVRLKTFSVLQEMNLLNKNKDGEEVFENSQIIITDYSDTQTSGFPYQVRYAPTNGTRRSQMNSFEELDVSITTQPIGLSGNYSSFLDATSDKKISKLFRNTEIQDLAKSMGLFEDKFVISANKNHPRTKQKKTIIWRKKHHINEI